MQQALLPFRPLGVATADATGGGGGQLVPPVINRRHDVNIERCESQRDNKYRV